MTPHAELPPSLPSRPVNGSSYTMSARHHAPQTARNGAGLVHSTRYTHQSHLQRTAQDDLHDMICVGFGPASLAIAVALHDALEKGGAPPELSGLNGRPPKVAFLEKQPRFAWHAGMLLHGAKMQITFMKDMATLRNPKSDFTFINYLHQNDRLVEFTNLNTFLPQRIEYEDYMRWCAKWFEGVVEYSQDVLEVQPEKSNKSGKIVVSFRVVSRNLKTQEISVRRTRHVVIAVGGKPNIPKPFPENHPRVIHSSQYSWAVPQVLTDSQRPYRIAVIGAGQSAAEVFNNLQSQYPNSKTRLIIKGLALRPSDDSPFVNEVFNPSKVDDIYNQDPELRAAAIAEDRATNYGVVRVGLLEHIYETLYTQRIQYDSEEEWPHRILNHCTVTGIENSPEQADALRLNIKNDSSKWSVRTSPSEETFDADIVVVAAGYRRDAHKEMLKPAQSLKPSGADACEKWNVARDYRVKFEEGSVSDQAAVWLQGCNESTHGLSDTLLSILAVRGGEMVESIFGGRREEPKLAANGTK